jgi:hypothetical protein
LKEPLHGEHFGHAVGDGRPRGEYDPAASVHSLQVADLQEHVKGALRCRLRQAGDASHFGHIKQILEIMGLVHEQAVHTQFFERQPVVFLVGCRQLLEFALQLLLGSLQGLDNPRITILAFLLDGQSQLAQVFFEEFLLGRARHWNLFETGMSDDHGVPIAGRSSAHQRLAFLLLEILFGGHEDVRGGI